MEVAIYGAGAMGTVLGAYISRAGFQVDLINRNKEHINALKKYGAEIIGTTYFTQQVSALLPEEMTKKYDIILLMTKQKYNKEISQFLLPFLKKTGVICTMQNGIPETSVAQVIGNYRTLGCTMSWGATFHGKGVCELTSKAEPNSLTFSIGKYDNNQEIFDYIIKLLTTMGKVKIEENFTGARWAKLLVNAAFSGLSVVTGGNFGEISKNKKAKVLALKAIKECIDVAEALNIKIEPIQGKDVVKLMNYNSWIKKQISLILLPIAMKKHRLIKSSMLRDIERGKATEIDEINGVVSNHGRIANINTPVNDRIIEIVHKIENKEIESSWNNLELMNDLL